MDPLNITASIIAVLQLSAKVLAYLNDVKDSSKDRAQCAIEASNLHNLLVNLRFRLEGDSAKPWYTAVRALAVENGPLDQFRQALELLRSRMTEGGRLQRIGEALVWKFKKEEIASILSRMERLKSLIEVALQMDHFKISEAIKEDTAIIKGSIPEVQFKLDKIQIGQNERQTRKLLEWLSSSDYPAQQSDILNRRQKGTCQWFLEAPEFARWLSEPRTTLFCPGIPGAGKTMISAVAIDHLHELVQGSLQDSSVAVAYVFLNYNSREQQDVLSILAAILKQLVQRHPSSIEPIRQLHDLHVRQGTKPTTEQIVSNLQDVLVDYSTAYIVVDALDECRDNDGTRDQLLIRLRDLQLQLDVRLMFTSRFIPDIVGDFNTALKLEVRASNYDVKQFVSGQLHRLPKRIQRDLVLRELVQDKIAAAVDGMFLLARLHLDSLLDKRTPKELKLAIAKLSEGSANLDEAYSGAIRRIESQLSGDVELARKVLTWITFARRPLTTAEICNALAVEPGESKLDPDAIPDVDDLISVCAGLVVIDPERAVIRLVHYTTQEYLERVRDSWDLRELYIASTCLNYLSFDCFKSGSCSSDREFVERVQDYKLLVYAAKYWGDHAREVQPEVCDQACSLLLDNGLLSSVTQAQEVEDIWYQGFGFSQFYPQTTRLQQISQFGLHIIAQNLLSISKGTIEAEIDTRDGLGITPLLAAGIRGHCEMVELLLDIGANPDSLTSQYEEDGGPLYQASLEGHENMVELLISHGANVNQRGGHLNNALQAASYAGNTKIVRLLLENGSDLNANGGIEGQALQVAAYWGHEKVVSILLDNGANVNAKGGQYNSALESAILAGNDRIAKLLIQKGANVNGFDSWYGSHVNHLAFKGYTDLLRLAFEQHHAIINVHDSHGRSALHWAAKSGKVDTFEYLLDLGFDPATKDAKGETLLHYAASGGSTRILNMILDKNLDTLMSSEYWSPLHWACREGKTDAIELLLRRGFSGGWVTLKQPQGNWSPMSVAAFHGNGEALTALPASFLSRLNGEVEPNFENLENLSGLREDGCLCDSCFNVIYGPRFNCLNCHDFDYCFMCKPFLDHLHPNHSWQSLD